MTHRSLRHGLLVIDKPVGPTSMQVVARVKRCLGLRKAGHTGTLDPIASGVLPVCLGAATRLAGMFLATDKVYRTELQLGVRTDTCDAEGQILDQSPLPPDLTVASLDALLEQWRGTIEQVPPAFSALKVKGRRAYELARQGKAVELAPRQVTIARLELEAWDPPFLTLLCEVSKGTYIRALIRDIGDALGCGAHMTALRRLRVGRFSLDQAVSLEALQEDPSLAADAILPLADLFPEWPVLPANAHEQRLLQNGCVPHSFADFPPQSDTPHKVLSDEGDLLVLLEHRDGAWRLLRVFPTSS